MLAGQLRGARLLDVGTGDGTYAIEAARRGARSVGLDLDPRMIEAARRRAAAAGVPVALCRGTVEALPFADASFERVVAITVLCFVRDVGAAFSEMARVLVPGGRLVVGELARWSTWAVERRLRGRGGDPLWRTARFWSRRDLAAEATRAGLHVDAVEGAIFYPRCASLARTLKRLDPLLTRIGAPGAAFLALSAGKAGLFQRVSCAEPG